LSNTVTARVLPSDIGIQNLNEIDVSARVLPNSVGIKNLHEISSTERVV